MKLPPEHIIMTTPQHTYTEIANAWGLWQEYIDPSGVQTEEQWLTMPLGARIRFIEACFGPEIN